MSAKKAAKKAVKKAVKKTVTKKPAVEKKPKADRVEMNGMVRPSDGTTTGSIWKAADTITEKMGRTARRGELMQWAKDNKMKTATASTQYARWRVFNGTEGRLPTEKQEAAAAAK